MTGVEIEYFLGLYFAISTVGSGLNVADNLIKFILGIILILMAFFHFSLIGV